MSVLSLLCKQPSFKQQLETFRPRLYRIAYSWSHNPDLADDLVQETMVKALRKSEQVRNREAIDGWLFGILTNCWRDYFRRRKELENIDNVILVEETTPVHHMEQQNIVDKVRAAIATLPAGQCQVLTLVDLEEMSYAEVANVLDVPIGTVMSRLCRARRTLSGKLLEFQPEARQTASHLRSVK
jgi:RNA polymerase sigma-70 factor (ECF subfamily)